MCGFVLQLLIFYSLSVSLPVQPPYSIVARMCVSGDIMYLIEIFDDSPILDVISYQQLLESMYLASRTRLDITYTVNIISRHIKDLREMIKNQASEAEDSVYNKHSTYSRSERLKRQAQNEEIEKKVRRFPYMVSVRWDNKITICIGTVISHWHILTAAHCIIRTGSGEQREAKRLSVRVGSKCRTGGGSIYKIKRWFAPFNYVRKDKANDIAVLELATFLEFSNKVNLIPLVSLADEPVIEEIANVQQPCFIFGWPRDSRKSSVTKNDILRIDDSDSDFDEYFDVEAVKVLSRSLCKTLAKTNYVSIEGETEVCSNYVVLEKPCKANTGGPLVCQLKQYGVLSRQKGCDKDTGIIVYSRTDIYFDFITDAMRRRDIEIERSGEMEKISNQSCLQPLENTFMILIVNLLLLCL